MDNNNEDNLIIQNRAAELKTDAEKKELKRKKKEKQKARRQKAALKKKQRKMPLPKAERLKIAPKWLENYDEAVQGKNIIKKYRKHFKIDPHTALEELNTLKYPLTDEQINKFIQTENNKVAQEQAKKRKRRERLEDRREQKRLKKSGEINLRDKFPNSDDTFYFIAGYTPGGVPYGVTWEEMGLEPYESTDE